MRYLLVLLALAAPGFCQNVNSPTEVNSSMADWSKLGPTIEGARGFTLHGRGIKMNRSGGYELWVKIVPENRSAFARRYDLPRGTDHVIQYATVDCEKRLVFLEHTTAYDSSSKSLSGRVTGLTPSSRKEAVRPGSIGEAVFRYVCVESTTLPLRKTED